jgi:hypothetical protein
MEQHELIEKIKRLPHDRIAEVERFVDSLLRKPAPDRQALDQAFRDYALQYGGTDADLDPDLEAAGIEHLLQTD